MFSMLLETNADKNNQITIEIYTTLPSTYS